MFRRPLARRRRGRRRPTVRQSAVRRRLRKCGIGVVIDHSSANKLVIKHAIKDIKIDNNDFDNAEKEPLSNGVAT